MVMKMFNKKLLSAILLINSLASIECYGTEYKTLASVIDKKIYNKDISEVSDNTNTLFNDNSNIYDINNYINDDFVNPNPYPLFLRGTLTEREKQYYLDRMTEIMNGKYMKCFKNNDEDEQSLDFFEVDNDKHNQFEFRGKDNQLLEFDLSTEYIKNNICEYAPQLVLDPNDKYTDREAQYFINDLIKNEKSIDKNVLERIVDKFGNNNVYRFINKFVSYIINTFDTLSKKEDVLDYYELLHYNLIQMPLNDADVFFDFWNNIRSIASQIQPNNTRFQIIEKDKYYVLLIKLQGNALQETISNIFKSSNNTNLLEKIIYNTNTKKDNVFILDNVTNSIISIIKDEEFIDNENNKNKLFDNFSTYIRYISNIDRIYIKKDLEQELNNKNTNYNTTQIDNLNSLVNKLGEQIFTLPIKLNDKNDLLLMIKANNENLDNILKYSFSNINIQNNNIKIIVNTLNDNNVDNNIKYNLLKYIMRSINSNSSTNGRDYFVSFCKNFVYLLEEENFYTLIDIIYKREDSNIYNNETSEQIDQKIDEIVDCLVKKMLELNIEDVNNVNKINIVKFQENVSKECLKKRTEFINNLLDKILYNENNSEIFSQSLNNSANNIYQKAFIDGIIDFVLKHDIFKGNNTLYLKSLNGNIINLFRNTINNLYENTASNKNVLRKFLNFINDTQINNTKTNNNLKTNNKNNMNKKYQSNTKNKKHINKNNQINVNNNNNKINNITSKNNINTNNLYNINEQKNVNEISNIVDQGMNYINELEKNNGNINNDQSLNLKSYDTLNLVTDNNINNIDNLVDFINENDNEQNAKTILNSIIDFMVKNEELNVNNENLESNLFTKLNTNTLKLFNSLVEEKQKNTSNNTELYNTYKMLLNKCKSFISNSNNNNSSSIKTLNKKRTRTRK